MDSPIRALRAIIDLLKPLGILGLPQTDASPDLELAWLDEDESDPNGLEAVLEARVKLGAVTLNEMRDALGLDPYANPAADRPMVLTATGYVPIEAEASPSSSSPAGLTRGSMPPHGRMDCRVEPGNDASLQKYNPDQPRVPAGTLNGEPWSSDAAATFEKASPDDPEHPGWPAKTPGGRGGKFRPKDNNGANSSGPAMGGSSETPEIPYQKYGQGHHWVPKTVYKDRKFSKETKAVFDNEKSGALADPTVNQNTKEHIAYNKAVNKLLDEFLKKNNITEEEMTPAQAEEFVEEVKSSTDPVIREFVTKIRREILRYIERYGPWRRGGGGDDD